MNLKYPKQIELDKVFELDDEGNLWRKSYIDRRGHIRPKHIIENKVNTSNGYCDVKFNRRMIKYHAIVWILTNGNIPENFVIDHVDGNKINNKVSNLRLVTQRENCQNKTMHRAGKLFGCSYHKHSQSWRAYIQIDGKMKYLGYYKTELEAHEAYKNMISIIQVNKERR